MKNKRNAVLVVGPPRSGTSVVANILSELGIFFGDPGKFIDPEQKRHNPIFFELASLNKINDQIFKHFSKTWSDFDWMPDRSDFSEVVCSGFEPTIEKFVNNEFKDSEYIGLKDPRFCYTLPVWETVLTKLGFAVKYILVRRLSSSIFKSNQTVNSHSSSTNFRLVAQSTILASRFVQNRPFVTVYYETLLREPTISVEKICTMADLPVERVETAVSVLNRKLQHHDESEKTLYKYFSNVLDLRDINPDEYDKYREIHLNSTHDKDIAIETLKLELAEKEAAIRDFPYWREALKVSAYFWQIAIAIFPPNSRRRGFVNSIRTDLINIYKRVNERKYQQWICKVEKGTEEERSEILTRITKFDKQARISVLMPVYNPPIHQFKQAIESVQAQLYPHWELCIADDASTDPLVRDLIVNYAKDDPRIRYVIRKTNGHISASSNSALELVTGEFTALLDHDDLLHPLALYYVAMEINAYPDAEIIYSDEDRINERGKRVIPYFKSDFDYDLLLRQNMISHLGVYRTNTIRKVGGFRTGYEGSQDYDLLLRIIDMIEPRQIRHICRVLYHWRISDASAASGAGAKPYAYDAGLRAVRDHLVRRKIDAIVEPGTGLHAYKVKYSIPYPLPLVDIIIFARNFTEKLDQCITSILLKTHYKNYKVKIYLERKNSIENQTVYTRWIQDDRISIIHDELETSRLKIINRAILNSKADYICLLDNNIYGFSADWLEQLVREASQLGVGAVGPLLLQSNGRIFSSGFVLTTDDIATPAFAGLQKYPSYFGWATIPKGFSVISDACFLLKRTHFLDIGGYNETMVTNQCANIDFCLRLREKGFRNIVTPVVELYMHPDTAYNQNVWRKTEAPISGIEGDLDYIRHQWKAWLEYDPSFNSNLKIKKGRILW